jgi:hypothetical protein
MMGLKAEPIYPRLLNLYAKIEDGTKRIGDEVFARGSLFPFPDNENGGS